MRLTASRASITSSGGAAPALDAPQQEDPTLDLNFEENKTLTDDVSGNNLITFSRASSGTYVDSDGLIKTAVADAPRFDHDPVTGESLGLLVEESRTNYCIDSENPAGWTVTNGASKQTFTAVTAPDGSILTQGFRLPDQSSRVYPTVSSPGTVVPVCSVYVRSVSGTATLNLFIQGAAVASDISIPSDRWLRISGTSASKNVTAFSVRGNASQSEDVYIWAAQLEEGSFPTSYIPTSGSTVTRSPDIATIEGTNFSSWYNQSEGTVFANAKITFNEALSISQFPAVYETGIYPNRLWSLAVNSTVNGIGIGADGFSGSFGTGLSSPQTFKVAQAISNATSTYSASKDGGSVITGSVSALDPQTIMRIGGNVGGTKRISRLTFFPTPKTDQELIDLTKP
jgi:hypothetical protein